MSGPAAREPGCLPLRAIAGVRRRADTDLEAAPGLRGAVFGGHLAGGLQNSTFRVWQWQALRRNAVAGISSTPHAASWFWIREDKPLTVDLEGDNNRNIIVWMDHRALAETDAINAGGYDVLRYVGGKLSPEMETPKLKWLKTHLPQTWAQAGKFLDLADYPDVSLHGQQMRAVSVRSSANGRISGMRAHRGRWDTRLFPVYRHCAMLFEGDKIGRRRSPDGIATGQTDSRRGSRPGLDNAMPRRCRHHRRSCGRTWFVGSRIPKGVQNDFQDAQEGHVNGEQANGTAESDTSRLETALALIGGTSNCHMAVSREPKFINGIWGPYYGAMVPGLWLTEGGQSAAGSAIDHVIADHANAPALNAQAEEQNVTVYQLLNAELERLQTGQWTCPISPC